MPPLAPILSRLAGTGGDKWAVHFRACALAAEGREIIALTIGEPDLPTPGALIDVAADAMRAGRTRYSNGQGEPGLRRALAARYSASTGRAIAPDQILCFPGTQTALYTVMAGLAAEGDEVLVGDPLYATYEGVIRASGARMVGVPLRPLRGFRMDAADLAAAITARSRVILLNTPHNPTGAVLRDEDIDAIGALARAHDLWILCDEVYAELIFGARAHVSPLARADLADRVIVVSSISKSHAAPGFRSGWAVGPADWAARQLALCEVMLFSNQPFIADMTEAAIAAPCDTTREIRDRLARRAGLLAEGLRDCPGLAVHRPEAGMFALLDVSGLGMDGESYAFDLLERAGVAVMPGAAFGSRLGSWVRVALTVPDDTLRQAVARIRDHAGARHGRDHVGARHGRDAAG